MYDPIIKELFPNRKSLYMEQLLSAPTHDSFELPESYERNDALWKRHNLDYLNGDYNLSHTCSHYGQNFFPSTFARKALLYLQLLCSVTFSEKHYTIRKDLPSYLIAQTFYGKGLLRYDGKEYTLVPGDLFFIDCRQKHEYFAVSKKGWDIALSTLTDIPCPNITKKSWKAAMSVLLFQTLPTSRNYSKN